MVVVSWHQEVVWSFGDAQKPRGSGGWWRNWTTAQSIWLLAVVAIPDCWLGRRKHHSRSWRSRWRIWYPFSLGYLRFTTGISFRFHSLNNLPYITREEARSLWKVDKFWWIKSSNTKSYWKVTKSSSYRKVAKSSQLTWRCRESRPVKKRRKRKWPELTNILTFLYRSIL